MSDISQKRKLLVKTLNASNRGIWKTTEVSLKKPPCKTNSPARRQQPKNGYSPERDSKITKKSPVVGFEG
jgi:hypothetical protein